MDQTEFIQTAIISNVQGFLEGAGLKGVVLGIVDKDILVKESVDLALKMWEAYTNIKLIPNC